jgi:hypothetical protein
VQSLKKFPALRGNVVGVRQYAISRKVAGTSPDEVDFFQFT